MIAGALAVAVESAPLRACRFRGGSSAGRASRSQCEGREFDPPPLHQYRWKEKAGLEPVFFCSRAEAGTLPTSVRTLRDGDSRARVASRSERSREHCRLTGAKPPEAGT